MILHEFIDVNISSKNKKLYQNKGYNIASLGIYSIKTVDLLEGARVQEERKCDCCGKILFRSHKQWADTFRAFNKDLCPDCGKRENKKRIKESNLKKYGVEFPMQSKEIREKASQTSLEKYGCKHPLQSQVAKDNSKKAVLEKYGVDNVRRIKEVNDKISKTNLKKYGCENPFGNEAVQDKLKKTIMKKYGVENISQNDNIKEKKKQTTFSHYGVEYPVQSEEIREKMKLTWLKNFGVDNPFKDKGIREKSAQTLFKNNKVPTSKPQIELFNICKEMFPNCEIKLNYPASTLFLDICVIFPNNIKIDIEYDGWYWHNSGKDFARDYIIKKWGYKIIRVKSGKLLPTKEQLKESLIYLFKNNKDYSQIILSDWKYK